MMRITVIGDSWASKRKVDASIAGAFSDCGIAACVRSHGYPGKRSDQIAHLMPVVSAGVVVLMVGLNDTVQHTGAANYRRSLVRILGRLQGCTVVALTIPRYDSARPSSKRLLDRVKHAAMRWLMDGGTRDVIKRYRAAVADLPIRWLNSDEFLPAFGPERFSGDGRHLTATEYDRLGAWIGHQLVVGYENTPRPTVDAQSASSTVAGVRPEMFRSSMKNR